MVPKYELLIDGSPVDPVLTESVVTIAVHKHLELADMLEVKVGNDDLAWTQGDLLMEGKEIALKLGYEETSLELVFTGDIVRRDCVFPVRGPASVTVVAYDKKHHLKRGRESKVYQDMSDSEIVQQVAGEVGLSVEADSTPTKHKWVFQENQTPLAFLCERARRVGYALKIDKDNKKLLFKKPAESGAVATLTWGQNLLSFKPRMSTADQVSSVTVKGWHMDQKKPIEEKVEARTAVTLKLDGSKTGSDLAPKAATVMPSIPMHDPAEAKGIGESIINSRASGFCEGTGSCAGDPLIDTGTVLEIDGVGKRAGGQYFVKEVMHHYEAGVGFYTRFGVERASEQKSPDEREELPKTVPTEDESQGEQANWVTIRVRSETGESLEGVSYTVTLPNGEQRKGTLDETQVIKIEGIRDPGEAKIELEPPEGLEALE